ncbi:MAG TPA: hydrolase, partial [Chitinophagaceae bacterium]|nr:hydrolase [Chitinophagaceae bacterium]
MSLQLNRSVFGNPANAGTVLSREEAYQLFTDWVKNERLQLHMKQVAHLMKCWAAEKEGLNEADQWRWEMA